MRHLRPKPEPACKALTLLAQARLEYDRARRGHHPVQVVKVMREGRVLVVHGRDLVLTRYELLREPRHDERLRAERDAYRLLRELATSGPDCRHLAASGTGLDHGGAG